MNTRTLCLCAALALAGCTTNGRESDLSITTTTLATASTVNNATVCTFTAGGVEVEFPLFNPNAPGFFGFTGFVVKNQLTNPTTLNQTLRVDTTSFNPHQAVVDYQIIGGGTLPQQIIPTSGQSVASGASAAVGVPLFLPNSVITALKALAEGTVVRTTTHIEGKLEDGTTVSTSEHDYVVQITQTGTTVVCF